MAARRPADAERFCQQLLTLNPRHTQAKILLANIAAVANRKSYAEQLLREVVKEDPNSIEGLLGLGAFLSWGGDVAEAVELCQRAIKLRPDMGSPHYHLGRSYLKQKSFTEAAASFETALRFDPNVATLHHHLGVALQESTRSAEAAKAFERAIALDPRSVLSYAELGHLYLSKGNLEAAVSCYRKAYELQPDSARGNYFLGKALVEERKFDEGEKYLGKALSIEPDLIEAQVLMARVLQQFGNFDEAEKHLRRAIEKNPKRSDGYYLLVTGRRMKDEDRDLVEKMLNLVSNTSLSPVEKRSLEYSLGKVLDDLGDYEQAMVHYSEANRLSQERLNALNRRFDRRELSQTIDLAINRFTKSYLDKCAGIGLTSGKPIFIVGMPRSGTTLLEQIVSSHPQVAAAGELGTWTDITKGPFQGHPTIPTPEVVREIGARFLKRLESVASKDAQFITEKTPQNYMALVQILATFPNTHILHCKRNAVDTCLSIYTTSFMAGPDFAHDLDALVFAYKEYERVMDHWRSVLPPNRFMEVSYEDVVSDREPVLREILAFLGLQWDDACMHHEQNENAISTPSLWQARQPVFTNSKERWRKYEPWLGPLANLKIDWE
jgi:tetratricopeptide (TPR) repeat protein